MHWPPPSPRRLPWMMGLVLVLAMSFWHCQCGKAAFQNLPSADTLCFSSPPSCPFSELWCRDGVWVCVPCINGEVRSCYDGPEGTLGLGSCRSGLRTCTQGSWSDVCEGQRLPASQEACGDGQDNNCNGRTDEGCACTPQQTQPCGSNIGECRPGIQTCLANGQWDTHCVGQNTSSPERCNSLDDDCNGQIDEGLRRPCRTVCGNGIERCNIGQWQLCTAPRPKNETCNNKDDDCDGLIDESLSQSCHSQCSMGKSVCRAGKWDQCDAPAPTAETCNNKDDDCNGTIDDNSDEPCQQQCRKGLRRCKQGKLQACDAPAPGSETCNNKDDDCNGKVDDQLTRACNGSCGPGIETCQAGKWGSCQVPSPPKEVCDGKDNDCDGQTDEDWPNKQKDCERKDGKCVTKGKWVCNDDKDDLKCNAPEPPEPKQEECDDRDNDCDGKVDEAEDLKPPPCDSSQGVCKGQKKRCIKGEYKGCNAKGYEWKEKRCKDKKDNDCDGKTDKHDRDCKP